MKQIGKIGEANIKARNKIAEIAGEKGLDHCELFLDGCLRSWPLAPAHRHRRGWYHGDADLLADYRQWVAACQHCHDIIENDPQLTEEMFMRLRGKEV